MAPRTSVETGRGFLCVPREAGCDHREACLGDLGTDASIEHTPPWWVAGKCRGASSAPAGPRTNQGQDHGEIAVFVNKEVWRGRSSGDRRGVLLRKGIGRGWHDVT